MKIRSLPFSLAAIALATATSFAPLRAEQALDTTAISVAPGRTGKMMPGDVYRVGLPRTDLHVTIDGLVLKPGFAVGGYAVYKAEPQGTLVLGDMVLLPSESPPSSRALNRAALPSRPCTTISSTKCPTSSTGTTCTRCMASRRTGRADDPRLVV